MNVIAPPACTAATRRRCRRGADGSAVLVLLAFLSIMVILIGSNAQALNRLEQEIKSLDRIQQRKFVVPPKPAAPGTNAPTAALERPQNPVGHGQN